MSGILRSGALLVSAVARGPKAEGAAACHRALRYRVNAKRAPDRASVARGRSNLAFGCGAFRLKPDTIGRLFGHHEVTTSKSFKISSFGVVGLLEVIPCPLDYFEPLTRYYL